jgi:hypothetical protein
MRLLIILFYLFSYNPTPKINLHLESFKPKENILSLSDKYVKFTMSVGVNKPNWFIKPMDKCGDFDGSDYFNVGQFDIRLKIYISKRFRIINKVLIKGDIVNKYVYQTGIIYKF